MENERSDINIDTGVEFADTEPDYQVSAEYVQPRRKFTDNLPEQIPLRILAFLFPFLTIVSAFAIMQVYPIGDRTILTVDCYHQYAPFLCELREKIVSGKSLFYSWNCGLGNEYYAAYANYSASPLNLLCVLFTPKAIPVFIAFITAVRAGLASFFMSLFLSEGDGKRYDYITVIFGCTYALCGWFLTDFWNIMWCDAMVILPLICLGLRRLLKEGRFGLYTASLAVCIMSNYYTGYFICIFLVFFAPAFYFMIMKPSVKGFFRSVVRFAVGSVTAGLISSVVVIPTYLILKNSSAVGDTMPKEWKLTGNLFDFMGRLLVAANPNIRDGMANVFCGSVTVILVILFFMAPKGSSITLRHKIGCGFMLLFLYLSFSNRTLNFIWHGFHFPNQIPYRQSFLMSFVMVFMAFMTIRIIRQYQLGTISAVVGGVLAYIILFEKFGGGNEGYIQIALSVIFVALQGTVLRIIRIGKRKNSYIYEYLITVTMFIEMFVTACVMISTVAEHEGFTGYDFYGKNRTAVRDYVSMTEGTEGHNTFERTELFPNNICDIQSIYDVKGLSIFSSTARESFIKYMRNFGFHNNGINGLRNNGITRVTATLLGVRNLIAIQDTQTVPIVFDMEYQGDGITVYGNPDALAVGYMVSEEILDYIPESTLPDVFAKTNSWVRSMGVDADVYLPISIRDNGSTNMTFNGITANGVAYTPISTSEAATATVVVEGSQIGEEMYIYANSSKGGRVSIKYADESRNRNFEIRSYQTICLGRYDGTPVTVELTYTKPQTGKMQIYAYELNNSGYLAMLDELADEQIEVTYYDETSLKGTVNVIDDGLLLMTIQYTDGFTAYVDGEKAEIVPVSDALCGIRLTSGTHTVKLEYKPEGFNASLLMTGAGIIAFVAILTVSGTMRKRRDADGSVF